MRSKYLQWSIWALSAVVLVLAVWSSSAQAETRVLLGGWSTHLVSKNVTNETHHVIGIDHKGWTAGWFKNSYDRPTWFAGKSWRWGNFLGVEHLEAIAGVGATYGYRSCWGDDGDRARVCPDATLGVAWTQYRLVPSLKLKGDAIVFQPEIKF